VLTTTKADTILQLKLEIVKHVIAVKKTEAEEAEQAANKKAQKPLLSKIAGSSSRLPDAQSGLIPVTLEWVPEQNHSQREKDQP
jgi:hypothetical protein